jgi:hypothetical protein
VAVKRLNTVLFIRKLGKREHSFGIRSKAGMPQIVILKAQEALRN